MHPNTACHTHDLLDCPCDREDVNGLDIPEGDSSDSEEEQPAKFISASQVQPGKADTAVNLISPSSTSIVDLPLSSTSRSNGRLSQHLDSGVTSIVSKLGQKR